MFDNQKAQVVSLDQNLSISQKGTNLYSLTNGAAVTDMQISTDYIVLKTQQNTILILDKFANYYSQVQSNVDSPFCLDNNLLYTLEDNSIYVLDINTKTTDVIELPLSDIKDFEISGSVQDMNKGVEMYYVGAGVCKDCRLKGGNSGGIIGIDIIACENINVLNNTIKEVGAGSRSIVLDSVSGVLSGNVEKDSQGGISIKNTTEDYLIFDNSNVTYESGFDKTKNSFGVFYKDKWHKVGEAGEPTLLPNSGDIYFRKDSQGNIQIQGTVAWEVSKTTEDADIFVLPVGYRPTAIVVGGVTKSGNDIKPVYVLTDGTVSIIDVTGLGFTINANFAVI
jgi:hypothetical protein